MIRYFIVIAMSVLIFLAFSGCKDDKPSQNQTNTSISKNTDTKTDKAEEKKVEKTEKTLEIKLAVKPADLEKVIGKPGKFKILYYHLGICCTCQEIIAKFDMLKTQFSEDFEFYPYLSYELESAGVELKDFDINGMTPSTGYLFDAENKIIWKKADPEFADFTKALKNAGLAKEVYEPPLPPDFFE